MNIKKQKGFTLVEIAIVLVIIGLLLGGILKGQELISSARVRNLADQNSGVQAAYYGFIDRYRAVPGDMIEGTATQAFGTAAGIGGDGDGSLENSYAETAALWAHLARSNFIGGGFTPATAAPTSLAEYAPVAPANAFGSPLVLSNNDGYSGAAGLRLNMHIGRNVPVNIARELDLKVDDGTPNVGILRLNNVATALSGPAENQVFNADLSLPNFADCSTVTAATAAGNAAGTQLTTDIYDLFDNEGDCGQVFIY